MASSGSRIQCYDHEDTLQKLGQNMSSIMKDTVIKIMISIIYNRPIYLN